MIRLPLRLALGTLLCLAAMPNWAARADAADLQGPEQAETAASVEGLLVRRYDRGAAPAIGEAERTVMPLLDARTTAGQSAATIVRLKRLMVHAMFEHDRRTQHCNALRFGFRMEPAPYALALPVCSRMADASQDLCALFQERQPAIEQVMGNFSRLYADPRLALDAGDIGFWRRTLACGAAPPARAARAEAPLRPSLRYMTELLAFYSERTLRGRPAFDGETERAVADYDSIGGLEYRWRLQSQCPRSSHTDGGLLQTMECAATGERERDAAASHGAAIAAADPDPLLRRLYPTVSPQLAQAERAVTPLLDLRTTAGEDQARLAALKLLMVQALFERDRRTLLCNELLEIWRMEPQPYMLALPICRRGPDDSQDLCALFRQRQPAIERVMRNFAGLYADQRLALGAEDIGFWHRTLACGPANARPPTARAATPPRSAVRYTSDMLALLSGGTLQGRAAFDDETVRDLADYGPDGGLEYRQALQAHCRTQSRYDSGLLRTIECTAAGLRERT
jgi:hypothetical protein